MTRSTVGQPLPDHLRPWMSQGYRLGSGPAQYYEIVTAPPAGSLSATGADMGRYMIGQLQNGTYNGQTILQPSTAIQFHAIQKKVYPALNGVTLGFYETSRNGHRVIAHNGGTQWFHSDMHLFLDDGVGIFISLNSAGKEGAAGGLHEDLYKGFADRYFPATTPLPPPAVDARTAKAHAALMAGYWEMTRRSDSNFMSLVNLLSGIPVTAEPDGALRWALPGHAAASWHEIAPFVWRQDGVQDKMQAIVVDGKPSLIGLDLGAVIGLQPVPAWRSPGWMVPAISVALLALLLNGVLWPVTALVRRSYGASSKLTGPSALTYRAVRGLGLGAAATFVAFPLLIFYIAADGRHTAASSHPLILGLEFLALVLFPSAALVSLLDLAMVWRGARGWLGKAWSVIIAASCCLLLWAGLVFHLTKMTTHY
jgi:hypothetical protein